MSIVASAQGDSARARLPIRFESWTLLESPYAPGRFLDFATDSPGVVAYTGGLLPDSLQSPVKMYTFKAHFRVGGAAGRDRLALYTGIFEYPFRVYVNGVEILSRGRHDGSGYNSSLRAAVSTYLSPAVPLGRGTDEIVVQAYPRTERWELGDIWIDRVDDVARAVFARNLLGIDLVKAIFMISLTMGTYALALVIRGSVRKKRNLLFFALCIAFCLSYLNVFLHHEAMPEAPLEALSKGSLPLAMTLLLLVVLDFVKPVESKGLAFAADFIPVVLGVASFAATATQIDKRGVLGVFAITMNFVILPELVAALALSCWALLKRRDTRVVPLLAAMIAVFVSGAHDIAYVNAAALPFAWMTPYGYFAYVIAIFVMLASDEARMYRRWVESSTALSKTARRIQTLNQEIENQRDSLLGFAPEPFSKLVGGAAAPGLAAGDFRKKYMGVLGLEALSGGIDRGSRGLREVFEREVADRSGFVERFEGGVAIAVFPWIEEPGAPGRSRSSDLALDAACAILHAATGLGLGAFGLGVASGELRRDASGEAARLGASPKDEAIGEAATLARLAAEEGPRALVSGKAVGSLVNPERFSLRSLPKASGDESMSALAYELLRAIDR
jgi:hypothetical protein